MVALQNEVKDASWRQGCQKFNLTVQQKSTTDRCEVIVQCCGASAPGAAASKGTDRAAFTVFHIPAHSPHPMIVKWPKSTIQTSWAAWEDLLPSLQLFWLYFGDLVIISVNLKQDCSYHCETSKYKTAGRCLWVGSSIVSFYCLSFQTSDWTKTEAGFSTRDFSVSAICPLPSLSTHFCLLRQ